MARHTVGLNPCSMMSWCATRSRRVDPEGARGSVPTRAPPTLRKRYQHASVPPLLADPFASSSDRDSMKPAWLALSAHFTGRGCPAEIKERWEVEQNPINKPLARLDDSACHWVRMSRLISSPWPEREITYNTSNPLLHPSTPPHSVLKKSLANCWAVSTEAEGRHTYAPSCMHTQQKGISVHRKASAGCSKQHCSWKLHKCPSTVGKPMNCTSDTMR